MDEQILAYIGKVLGNTGTMLAGNNQNLQQFGQQGAAANEGWLADIYRKEAEEKRKKEEEKGLWGGIINLGGTAASVAFPAVAPVIAPLTGVASGAMSGGTNGAIAGGINSAIPVVADGLAKSTTQPVQTSFENRTEGTPSLTAMEQGKAAPTPTQPIQQDKPQKQGFVSTLLNNPQFQSSITGITNKLTQPDRPQINTLGLNPETGFRLTEEFNNQNQREIQNRLDQEQLDIQRGRYAQEQRQYDEPKIISGTEPIDIGGGNYGYHGLQNGQVVNIPVSGYTPQVKPDKVMSPNNIMQRGDQQGFVDAGGNFIALPEGVSRLPDDNSKWRSFSGIPILENDLQALYGAPADSPEFGQAVDRLHGAMDVAQTLAPTIQSIRPPMPISVVGPSTVTQVPRPGTGGEVTTTPIPVDPVDQAALERQKGLDEQKKTESENTAKAKEGERVTSINDRIKKAVTDAATKYSSKKAAPSVTAEIQSKVSQFEKSTGKRVLDVSVTDVTRTSDNGYRATYRVNVEGEGMSGDQVIEGELNAK